MTPSVLIVDDAPRRQNVAAARLEQLGLRVRTAGPGEIQISHLTEADLVLVDFDLRRWLEREAADSIALQPLDGLALAAVLRSHLGYGQQTNPTAFALHTAHVDVLAADAPQQLAEHGLARIHNLEWVFLKNDCARLSAIDSLARPVDAMPDQWPENVNAAGELLESLLRLDGAASMVDEARRDLERAHPPTHELSSLSQGMTALRWMLQRILPYPCFLLDDWHLAARLGVTRDSLQRALEKPALTSALHAAAYSGFLSDFRGRRWWRAGIEVWIDEVSNRGAWSTRELGASLASRYPTLTPSEFETPVVATNGDHRVAGIVDARSAVRIQLDDWPSFAEPPWATVEEVLADDALAARVVSDDLHRISIGIPA